MISKAKDFLNLAAILERSVVNGPGERFVLWVQGCALNCPGCFSPEMQAFKPHHLTEIGGLARKILSVAGIEGVTYTGGEPMTQARGLALLSERVRSAGLTVVCYTGYTLEALRAQNDGWIEALLSCVDILIDGPYMQEKAANLLWRGSSNQRIHFLTDTYRSLAGQVDRCLTEAEFTIGNKGFTLSGTWPGGFLERLEEVLR